MQRWWDCPDAIQAACRVQEDVPVIMYCTHCTEREGVVQPGDRGRKGRERDTLSPQLFSVSDALAQFPTLSSFSGCLS
ncbi:hypothetical protein FKM82_029039 [Ascaphus truei]